MGKIVIGILVFVTLLNAAESQLKVGFYNQVCPKAEAVIQQAVALKYTINPVAGAGTLRLFFHDCMVRGCDGSVLLSSTGGNTAERDASENLSLPGDGFDTVVKAKAAVEQVCPGVVSCADVLALATRDMLKLIGGPHYQVETGRRDGRVSLASEVGSNLPHGNGSVPILTQVFANKGLSQVDLVTLSGGHSVGFVHCSQFANRLYPQVDRAYNPSFADGLRSACPQNVDDRIVVDFDATTPRNFDNGYFQSLTQHKGVLFSDQNLFTSPATRPLVQSYANNNRVFTSAFVDSMIKLGRVGVKVGQDGEIRKFCDRIN